MRQVFLQSGESVIGTLTAVVFVVVVLHVEHGKAVLALWVNKEGEVDLRKETRIFGIIPLELSLLCVHFRIWLSYHYVTGTGHNGPSSDIISAGSSSCRFREQMLDVHGDIKQSQKES